MTRSWSVSPVPSDCLAPGYRQPKEEGRFMSEVNEPKVRTRIIWSCSECGTVLPLWQVKCTNCHRLTLSWLHVIVFGAALLLVLFLVFRLL